MDNDDPRIIELNRINRSNLAKFGEGRCVEALALMEKFKSLKDVATKMNCSLTDASDMVQASMSKRMDDSGIDKIIADKRHLPKCPIPDCIDGKLSLLLGTQLFVCDKCGSKFKTKLVTKE